MKTFGVVGGMGPQATIHFYQQIIDRSQSLYGATKNGDYPHFLLSNLPVPDLISDQNSEKQTVQMVKEEMKRLENAGADLLVMTCNTMHLYQDQLIDGLQIPFLSMIDAVVDRVVSDPITTVGVLGSSTSMQFGLYEKPLKEKGVRVLLLSKNEQTAVTECILRLVAGNMSDHDSLQSVVRSLKNRGAEAVILGCTELPFMLKDSCISLYKVWTFWRRKHVFVCMTNTVQ
jgi:aspartate racemase